MSSTVLGYETEDGTTRVLALTGQIGPHTVDELGLQITTARTQGHRKVVIDLLAAYPPNDPTASRLARILGHFGAVGMEFSVIGADPHFETVLGAGQISGLSLQPTTKAALTRARRPARPRTDAASGPLFARGARPQPARPPEGSGAPLRSDLGGLPLSPSPWRRAAHLPVGGGLSGDVRGGARWV